ncbi:MAG: MFS transporter [Bacteroidota bacterium]
MKFLTRTIWILSFISLFTDVASEMLYPVMPMYLTSIGFSVALIGMLEGIAEATAGLSKGYYGKLSDQIGKRKRFVQIGYSLSAAAKPLIILSTSSLWVFCMRTCDRMGKGIRTGARDAMLSAETTPEYKGRVFGFHRAFDTLGAALGPMIALLFLSFSPGKYQILFLIAIVPGLAAIGLTFFIKDNMHLPSGNESGKRFFSFLRYWKTAPHRYRNVVAGLLIFALFNSSDMFLLLMVRTHGMSDQAVIAMYIFYNIIFVLASYPFGMAGDRFGLKSMYIFGLLIFAVVYAGIGFVHTIVTMFFLFFLYGLYAAATEGISKAWISNLVAKNELSTAIGFYSGLQSLSTMLASSVTGWIWFIFGPAAAFEVSAGGTLLAAFYLFLFA